MMTEGEIMETFVEHGKESVFCSWKILENLSIEVKDHADSCAEETL